MSQTNNMHPLLSAENLLLALQQRYATKKFDPNKKISANDLQILSQSLRLAPSSFGLQPWRFVIIGNQELKEQLRKVSYNQAQVTDCSHLIVLTTLKEVDTQYIERYIQLIAQTRGNTPAELQAFAANLQTFVQRQNPAELQAWTQRQVYIPLGFLLLSASLLGLDACPMEGIDIQAYNQILALEPKYTTTVACAVGYRLSTDEFAAYPKVRLPLDEVCQFID